MNNSKSTEQRLEQSIEQLIAQDIDSLEALNIEKRIKIAVENEARKIAREERQHSQQGVSLSGLFSRFKSKLVVAGSSAFAAVFLSFLVIMGGTSQSAFAKVQKQLVSIHNLYYQSKMFVQQQVIMEVSVWYQEPGSIRVETKPITANGEQATSINLIDSINGKGLMLFSEAKVAMAFEFNANAASDPKQNPLHWFDVVKDYQGEVVELEQRFVKDQWLQGFLIKESGLSIVLWSSVDNNLPIEISIYDGESEQTSGFHILGQLSFNQEFDQQLFKLQVPDGYQLAEPDRD